MPQYNFSSPGADASDAIIKVLAQRQAEQRQAMLDQILGRNVESQIEERKATSKRADAQAASEDEARKATAKTATATGQRAAAEIVPRGSELTPELEEALGPFATNSDKSYGVLSGADPNMQGPTEKKVYKGTAKQEATDEALAMKQIIAQMQADAKSRDADLRATMEKERADDRGRGLDLRERALANAERVQALENELRGLKITGEKAKNDEVAKATAAKRSAAVEVADNLRRSIGDLVQLGPDGQPVLDANKLPQLSKGAADIVGGSRWSIGLPEALGGKGMIPGAIAEKIPGTQQANARAALKQVVGEKIIALMQEMKSQSKTGATGFGALSEKELDVLQSSAARLDTAQTDEAFARELVHINALLEKVYQNGDVSVGATTPGAVEKPKSRYNVTIGKD